jgi:hypothetical protein
MNSMSRRTLVATLLPIAVGLASAARAQGDPPANSSAMLFQNVRIFDGKTASLSAPSNVLIKGNIIERISTAPIAAEPGVTAIAGNGRTLMPGLIDAHWHAMLIRPNPAQAITGDAGYNNILGLAYDTPGSSQGQASEFGTLTGYTRLTVSFQSASTIGQSASNMNAIEFGPFSSIGSALGLLICDNQTVGSTNYLAFNTLWTARTFGTGDTIYFAPGAVVVVLS